jgi:hypothetical protein
VLPRYNCDRDGGEAETTVELSPLEIDDAFSDPFSTSFQCSSTAGMARFRRTKMNPARRRRKREGLDEQ